jgi:parvulin-like peptidyl-prolyl isomerase
MGTLQTFRKVSPYALGLFALVFVGFMVLSDADISTLIRKGQTLQNASIGKVNGETISYKEYEEKVRQQIEQEKSQQNDPEAQVDETKIRQQVWDQMVDNILINQEAKKMGINVTAEEIRDELIDNPPDFLKKSFVDSSGRFLKDVYLELITNPQSYVKYLGSDPNKMSQEDKDAAVNRLRKDLIEVEDYIRKSKLYKTIQTTVGLSSSFISPTFAMNKIQADSESADVKLIALRTNLIKFEDVKVSDQEIQKYYDAHKDYYTQKNEARIKYISFPIQPSKDDSLRAAKHLYDIEQALSSATGLEAKDSIFDIKMSEYGGETTDFKPINQLDPQISKYLEQVSEKQIVGPINKPEGMTFIRFDAKREGTNPVIKASHILIKFNNNKDSALAVAKEILKKARSGANFADLAKTYSEDKGSAINGGDLGFFGKGQMVKPFEEAAFAANVGEIVGPVESQFGYHIIKVTDKNSTEIKYSTISIKPTISNATKNSILREAYSISKQIEEGTSIDTLAKRINKKAVETPFFTKERPIFNSWYLTNQSFDLEVGKVIEPIELKMYGIIVAQVSGKRKPGIAPLEDKKDEIKNILIHRKQLDMLKEQANQVYNKVRNFSDLEQAKLQDSTLNVYVANGFRGNGGISGLPKDVVVNETVFNPNTSLGAIIGPIRGENGYYIIQVSNRQIPNENTIKANLPNFLKQQAAIAAQNAFYVWYQKIKENAEIEDYRSKFFKDF